MRALFRALFLIGLISMACSQEVDESANYKPLKLLSYDVPITILAPDSAKVEVMDFKVQKDITVKKGDDYSIQIYAGEASTNDVSKLKQQQLEETKNNQYFSKIIQEDEDGFIYERMIDSTYLNYGFKHFRIKGDREYIFQNALIGRFTLDQAKMMYKCVRPNAK